MGAKEEKEEEGEEEEKEEVKEEEGEKEWEEEGEEEGGKEEEEEEEEGGVHVAFLKLGCLQHLLQHSGGVGEIERNIFRHLLCCTQLYHAVGRRTLWTSRRSSLPLATPAHKVPTTGQIEASTGHRMRLGPASTAQYSPLH